MDWIRRFVLHFGKRHPRELGTRHVEAFLSNLAVTRRVAASTQNQAKAAFLFLYREVLELELPWLEDITQARSPQYLAEGKSVENIVAELPDLTEQQIAACLDYTRELAAFEVDVR